MDFKSIFFLRNLSLKGDLTMSEVRGEGGYKNGFNKPTTISHGPTIVTVDQPHFSFSLKGLSHLCSSLRNQGGAPQSRLMNFKRASDPSSTSKKIF